MGSVARFLGNVLERWTSFAPGASGSASGSDGGLPRSVPLDPPREPPRIRSVDAGANPRAQPHNPLDISPRNRETAPLTEQSFSMSPGGWGLWTAGPTPPSPFPPPRKDPRLSLPLDPDPGLPEVNGRSIPRTRLRPSPRLGAVALVVAQRPGGGGRLEPSGAGAQPTSRATGRWVFSSPPGSSRGGKVMLTP